MQSSRLQDLSDKVAGLQATLALEQGTPQSQAPYDPLVGSTLSPFSLDSSLPSCVEISGTGAPASHSRWLNLQTEIESQAESLTWTIGDVIVQYRTVLELFQQSQIEDPSWMYIGMVANAAMHMGLDKTEDETLFGHRHVMYSNKTFRSEYWKLTWIACFQVSTQLSSWLGLPSHFSSASQLRNLWSFCQEPTIPKNYASQAEIQRQIVQYMTTIGDTAGSNIHIYMARLCDQDLDKIKSEYATSWSQKSEINLQAAKLYLYALCFLPVQKDPPELQGTSDTSIFLIEIFQKGLNAAITLIQIMSDLAASKIEDPPCDDYENNGCPILAYPKHYFRVTTFAAVFLLKYIDSNSAALETDREVARRYIDATRQLFRRFPSSRQLSAAANMIEVLGRLVVPGQHQITSRVKSRMSASLIFDALWAVGEAQGRREGDLPSTKLPHVVGRASRSAMHSESQNAPALAEGHAAEPPTHLENNSGFPWDMWDFDSWTLGRSDFMDFENPNFSSSQ
ncbi:hypothetical protein G7Y89_g11210 [Cudoniella acicularis]|uniref:Xylanolytic transcriptional activator regulatory domain-containing protein n=1 Tax=Cudoniella acicularis TaxID=354080 RepID=A0A8H4RE29_9HELO|nr:hypothetical protein G7Y89_g11210 [Cudoniella acicularis]